MRLITLLTLLLFAAIAPVFAGPFDDGLAACEALIAGEPGPFCFGATPTIADLCLVPQLFNARRFGVDVAAFPRGDPRPV